MGNCCSDEAGGRAAVGGTGLGLNPNAPNDAVDRFLKSRGYNGLFSQIEVLFPIYSFFFFLFFLSDSALLSDCYSIFKILRSTKSYLLIDGFCTEKRRSIYCLTNFNQDVNSVLP